jgi:hypothetical protein
MHPEDVDACLAFARCAAGLGQWSDVEAATAGTLAAADRNHPGAAELHYLRGLALGRLGQNGEARHELEWAGSLATPGSELQTAAAAEARKLGAARR